MFERYTESARRVLFFARSEASMKGSPGIESEHLLAGLLREDQGVVPRVLRESNVERESLQQDYERRAVFVEQVPMSREIPFSRATQAVLQLTVQEADGLRHGYIGPEHLLLALLRQEGTIAGSILASHGLRVNQVRETVARVLAEPVRVTAEARSEAAALAEQIKQWVDELARGPAGGPEAETMTQRLHAGIDAMRRLLGG